MAGAEKGKLDPNKTQIEPVIPFSQTTDFSGSATDEKGSLDPTALDAYATQFADRAASPESQTGASAPRPSDPRAGDARASDPRAGDASASDPRAGDPRAGDPRAGDPRAGDPRASDPRAKGESGKPDFPSDIPGFIVESELGRGAFGVVYGARDELLDRRVAIKKPLISNPAHRQQYIDEARKAVKLDHPSIVPIYQVGMTTGGEPFVVQKLIEGSTLRDLLQKGDFRLPIPQTISIMRQVCLAVDAAHTAGIVHRDLKPENLLVEPEGRVYVADFGLAILEDDEQNKKGREVAGTPLYMSPEQFAGRVEWLDGRSDIWALGVILYELLSGKTPFSGSTLNELRDQIKNKDPRPIHQRDPKIPSAFDVLFRKCCAKNVGDRFATVREMIAELDVVTESLPFLETVNLFSQSKTGAFKALSSAGSAIESGQGTPTSRGLSTKRSVQTSVQNSIGGASLQEPSKPWKIAGPALAMVALVAALSSGAWYAKLGPFADRELPKDLGDRASVEKANTNAKNSSAVVVAIEASSGDKVASGDKKIIEPPVEPISLVPSKPFRVSISGNGTHNSIAKAIADSAPGETVTILEGTYRESLEIDRSIKLVGEGTVTVLSTRQGCVKVQADSQVSIENVAFDSQAAKFNAIEVAGGRLELMRCDVFTSSKESFNCVKIRGNSALVADKCNFQTTLDAAISGEALSSITVRDSAFRFSGNADSVLKRMGIQAKGSHGLIQRCIFVGPCNAGIDWRDSLEQKLIVEGCDFDQCDIGIQTKGCQSVSIQGTGAKACEIKNAVWGLSIKQSSVNLSWVNVLGVGKDNKVGLQITEDSRVKCNDCSFSKTACGLLVNLSAIEIDNVSVHDSNFVGMLIDSGTAEGSALRLLNGTHYGLVVLSKGSTVKLDSLVVQAAPVEGQKIIPAVYVASGKVSIKTGQFSNCLCGIFVDPRRELINATGFPEKRSLVDLIGDPKKITITQTPVVLESDNMTLTDCDVGWIFNGAGSSQVKQLDGNLTDLQRKPRLPDDLEMVGNDLANFKVVEKVRIK